MLLMASLAVSTLATGKPPPPTGNEAFSGSPSSGTYKTNDGLLSLASNNQPQFARLCKAIGLERLLSDPRFAPGDPRKQNQAALREEFAAVFATKSADAWEAILDEARVPAVRVRRLDEALNEPQLAARGLMRPVALPSVDREVAIPTLGFKANGDVTAAQSPPPTLGQHTDEVLGALGLDVARLRVEGVV